MGERKVVNKFIPWDFDPDKVSKVKLSNIGQFTVRMMLPFTVRCNSCGEFMYSGKKFNVRKETANGEDYLGIPIERFYFKCTNCEAEFIIQTDPKNSDYAVVSGATRNSVLWKNERQLELEDKAKAEAAENMDAIQELENRTEESKREMDIYDALDLLQAKQRKTMNADPEEALEVIRRREREKEKEEKRKQIEDDENDEKELRELLKKKREEEDAKNEASYANLFKPKTQEVKVLPNPPLKNGLKLMKKKKTEPKKATLGLVAY